MTEERVTDSQLLKICKDVMAHLRETKDNWPWTVFMLFPTIQETPIDSTGAGIQRVLDAWWLHLIGEELYGSHMFISTDGDYEATEALAYASLDLLADHCREVIEGVGANDRRED